MSRNFSFKRALAMVVTAAGGCALVGWAFATALGHIQTLRPPMAAAAASAAHEQPLDLSAVQRVAHEPVEFHSVVFSVEARASADEEPQVHLRATPSATPCVEPAWLDARQLRSAWRSSDTPAHAQAQWCLNIAPGQHLKAEPPQGEWVTMAGRRPAVESAFNYLRVRHASGKWLGLRAAAVAYCADASGPCSAGAIVELQLDDGHLTVPLPLRGHVEVLRLVSGQELLQATALAEPYSGQPAPAEDEEPAVGEVDSPESATQWDEVPSMEQVIESQGYVRY